MNTLAEKLNANAMRQLRIVQAPVKKPVFNQTAQNLRQLMANEDIQRIVSMPIVEEFSREEKEDFCRNNTIAYHFDKGWRLFGPQIAGLAAYKTYSGLFGAISVGWGKTLLTLMIAHHAYTQEHLKKIILLIPSNVYAQLMMNDLQWSRGRVPFEVPVFGLGNKSKAQRESIARSGKPGLYVMPYSVVSTRTGEEVLEAIAPELVICDEAHNLKNRKAARTRRMLKVIHENGSKLVCLSGTITSKSINDYRHLIALALKRNSPLPLAAHKAQDWAVVLDSTSYPTQSQLGPIMPLLVWATENFPHEGIAPTIPGFRKAYRCRFQSAPGVVTSEEGIGTSITFTNIPGPEPGQAVKDLMDKVELNWETPNGDQIGYAMQKYKWMYELSAGFFNELYWPTEEQLVGHEGIETVAQAEGVLIAAQNYFFKEQEYYKEVRQWLKNRTRKNLDTPFLLENDMRLHGDKNVGSNLFNFWQKKENADFEGRPDRWSRAVRVDPFKINHVKQWAEHYKKGIIWYHNHEIGQWLHEVIPGSIFWHAGEKSNSEMAAKMHGDKVCIISISAHHQGKNLQYFQDQVFAQWPRPAGRAEQALGRTHRNGQEADELIVHTTHQTQFDKENFAATINDSLYIHQTTGSRQKLIYGNYDPLPQIFPPEALREKGFQNVKQLNKEQRDLLNDKFNQGS
jgi:hypothetical protein